MWDKFLPWNWTPESRSKHSLVSDQRKTRVTTSPFFFRRKPDSTNIKQYNSHAKSFDARIKLLNNELQVIQSKVKIECFQYYKNLTIQQKIKAEDKLLSFFEFLNQENSLLKETENFEQYQKVKNVVQNKKPYFPSKDKSEGMDFCELHRLEEIEFSALPPLKNTDQNG